MSKKHCKILPIDDSNDNLELKEALFIFFDFEKDEGTSIISKHFQ